MNFRAIRLILLKNAFALSRLSLAFSEDVKSFLILGGQGVLGLAQVAKLADGVAERSHLIAFTDEGFVVLGGC